MSQSNDGSSMSSSFARKAQSSSRELTTPTWTRLAFLVAASQGIMGVWDIHDFEFDGQTLRFKGVKRHFMKY
jgi:hypothetical protein